jgi:hypothetical protein
MSNELTLRLFAVFLPKFELNVKYGDFVSLWRERDVLMMSRSSIITKEL